MAKIKEITYIRDNQVWHHRQFAYHCEGCGHEHVFAIKSEGGHHDFNMDMNNPTISPSLLQNFGGSTLLCHSYIVNGNIEYLGDCEHVLAGRTIPLPDIY